jgi:hypothetical protein
MTAILNGECILKKGWLASLMGFVVSLAGLFQHICLPNQEKVFATLTGKNLLRDSNPPQSLFSKGGLKGIF